VLNCPGEGEFGIENFERFSKRSECGFLGRLKKFCSSRSPTFGNIAQRFLAVFEEFLGAVKEFFSFLSPQNDFISLFEVRVQLGFNRTSLPFLCITYHGYAYRQMIDFTENKQTHNPKVTSSNLATATKNYQLGMIKPRLRVGVSMVRYSLGLKSDCEIFLYSCDLIPLVICVT